MDGKPKCVKQSIYLLDKDKEIDSPLSLVKVSSMVEPLGGSLSKPKLIANSNLGKFVVLHLHPLLSKGKLLITFIPFRLAIWYLLVCSWIINSPLEITVPLKRTPWPDSSSDLPVVNKEVKGFLVSQEDQRAFDGTATR